MHGLGRNRRDPSAWPASGKDRAYKPMVKSSGGQRESEGVVVPLIGVQHNAPGGKGPHFDHAGEEGSVTMPGRSSVSRMRENRTYGLKGGWGNGPPAAPRP